MVALSLGNKWNEVRDPFKAKTEITYKKLVWNQLAELLPLVSFTEFGSWNGENGSVTVHSLGSSAENLTHAISS